MNENIIIGLQSYSQEARNFITLEQEYKRTERDTVSPYDVNQMLARAMTGESATTYLSDACSFVRIKDGTVYIDLGFYVFPSDLDLQYDISTNLGTLSTPEYVEIYKSQDVIFDGSSREELEFIFDGNVEYQMPVFDKLGKTVEPTLTQRDTFLSFDKEVHTVLRADGIAKGYKYVVSIEFKKAEYQPALKFSTTGWVTSGVTYNRFDYPVIFNTGVKEAKIRIEFISSSLFRVFTNGIFTGFGNINFDFSSEYITIKKDGWGSASYGAYLEFNIADTSQPGDPIREEYNISNIQNEIIATWNENGEIQSEILSLDIPPCVEDLLTMCWEGANNHTWLMNLNPKWDKEVLNVYYSTCTGEVLAERWEGK